MSLYGTATTVQFTVWDTANNVGKTGDAANITLKWIKDGTAATTTNSCTEVDATNAPGVYKVLLTATECQALSGTLAGVSVSADVSVIPTHYSFVQLPNVAPGVENGLSIVDANGDVSINEATIADAVWDEDVIAAHNTADTAGDLIDDMRSFAVQLGNLTSGSAAINTTTLPSPNGAIFAVGPTGEVNNEDSTNQLNNIFHVVEDTTGTTDFYYAFDVGGNGVPVSITWQGYAQSNGDSYQVFGYNWVTSGWEQLGSIAGATLTTVVTHTFDLTNSMVGTGADIGKVHFRIYSTDGTKIATDRITCAYSVVSQSVGYADGAIWVDSAGVSGTEPYVNGVADNPCPWADALVIAANLGLKKFYIANDNTITLTSSLTDKSISGDHWYLDLGGQNINDSFVSGASVSGIGTATDHVLMQDCEIGAVTLPAGRYVRCGIGNDSGTFTAGSSGDYTFIDCYSLVPGSGSPSFAFSGIGASVGVNNRRWSGGATYVLDSSVVLSHEVLAGGGTTITTGGANVEIRGITRSLNLTLSGAGTVQFVGTAGPVSIQGTSTTTVNLYGIASTVANSSVNTTVNDKTIKQDIIDTIAVDVAGIDGDAIPDISGLSTFDPANDTVAHVTLVDTTTTNTDMRGTDGAITSLSPVTDAIASLGDLTAQEVWEYVTRELTTTGGVTAQEVWEYATRELTQSIDVELTAQNVWEYSERGLTEQVTVEFNNDKTGYELTEDYSLTPEDITDAVTEMLSPQGLAIIGQGLGSEIYTDTVTDGADNPVKRAYVKAFAVDDETGIDWTHIKAMDVTSNSGEYTFYLDVGTYIVTIEKNGVQLGTFELEVE